MKGQLTMRTIEHYYTKEAYIAADKCPFLEHLSEYLRGERTIPVSLTSSVYDNEEIYFTFTNKLMKKFQDAKEDEIKKAYEVALKYGFRGYSRGGKNGIFYIRKKDIGLLTRMEYLIDKYRYEILMDLQTIKFVDLSYVKIVWHNPSGERIVGVYNKDNNRIIFLDFASY